jgi:hypothetical protein
VDGWVNRGREGRTPLSLTEHNAAQIDLMRRMGVDSKQPKTMMAWISSHAGKFRELLESADNAPQARTWVEMLRRPEQRSDALEAIQRALLAH